MTVPLTEDKTLDRQHRLERQHGSCRIRLHFLKLPNSAVEDVVLDSLMDTFEKRNERTMAVHNG